MPAFAEDDGANILHIGPDDPVKVGDKTATLRSFPLPMKPADERYANHDKRFPDSVVYCKRCVVSNQRPRITFDEQGVCSACQFNKFKEEGIDWNAREGELRKLCDAHRSKDGSWDVVVPCSGGKDSAYVAWMLKEKYGMHPLCTTWFPHMYTEVGWENYQRFIHAGFDVIAGQPDGFIHRVLTRLAFADYGDPFLPFIYGQIAFPLNIACKFKIPLVFYGENGEVEYGGDMKNANKCGFDVTEDTLNHYFSGLEPSYWVKYGVPEDSLQYYKLPTPADCEAIGLKVNWMGYYHKWVPQENYYLATEKTGFICNPERSAGTFSKYASLDDMLDGFHYYLAYIKFGIGWATSDAAHEIRDGYIARSEGVALVSKFDGEFPAKHFKMFLRYIGITEDEFWKVIDSFRHSNVWEKKEDGSWSLKWTVQ